MYLSLHCFPLLEESKNFSLSISAIFFQLEIFYYSLRTFSKFYSSGHQFNLEGMFGVSKQLIFNYKLKILKNPFYSALNIQFNSLIKVLIKNNQFLFRIKSNLFNFYYIVWMIKSFPVIEYIILLLLFNFSALTIFMVRVQTPIEGLSIFKIKLSLKKAKYMNIKQIGLCESV